jgi:hypothetical protein
MCQNGTRFTLRAVLHCARRYHRTIDAELTDADRAERAREKLLYPWEQSLIAFRSMVRMLRVSQEQVHQWFGEDGLDALRSSEGDSGIDETRTGTEAVGRC